MAVVLRDADVAPPGTAPERVDVRLEGEQIVEIGTGLDTRGVDVVLQCRGGAVLPGLHDHHVHLRAAAAARTSVAVGPPGVADAAGLARRLRDAAGRVGPGDWLRAVGYHESIAGELDRSTLDHLVPDRPVRVQHASGAQWMLNSAALEALGVGTGGDAGPAGLERDDGGRPTGRLYREDGWLAARLGPDPSDAGALAAVSAEAAARGVTGFTDATPGRADLSADGLVAAAGDAVVQRLHLMAEPGAVAGDDPMVTLGPVKIVLDDPTLPSLSDFAGAVARAHRAGRPVAVHCVTRVQAVLTVAAIEQAGPAAGDRIEHGAVLGAGLLPSLRRLGLLVVTQPGMAVERGDRYLRDVEADEVPDLWRGASLPEAGVAIAGGSDAPFGPADPWVSIAAAVSRRTPAGALLGPHERLAPAAALRLFTGWAADPARSRAVRRGQPADLCVLDGPFDPARLGAPVVRLTVVAGRVVFGADGS